MPDRSSSESDVVWQWPVSRRAMAVVVVALLLLAVVLAAAIATAAHGSRHVADAAVSAPGTVPPGAPVVTVGALEGANGQALLWLRNHGKTGLNVQWLEYGDLNGMVASLSTKNADAVIVPSGTKLGTDLVVLGTAYTIDGGQHPGAQELIALKANSDSSKLRSIVAALQSDETIGYLNSLPNTRASSD